MKAWIHKKLGLPCFRMEAVSGWSLTAYRTTGSELLASGGAGVFYMVDAGAWPNLNTRYRAWEDGRPTDKWLMRKAAHPRMITDQYGRYQVPIIWQGDDHTSYDTRVTVAAPPDRAYPIARFTGRATMSGELTALTAGSDTERLRYLVSTPQPLWLVYDLAVGTVKYPDVPGARLIALEGKPTNKVGHRLDRMEREWTLNYTVLDPVSVGRVPLITYQEATDAGVSLGEGSYDQVAQLLTGMPA